MVKSPRARGKPNPKPRATTKAASPPAAPTASGSSAKVQIPPSLDFENRPNFFSASAVPGPAPRRKDVVAPATSSRDNPNLSIATPGSGGSKRRELVFYTDGERAPPSLAHSLPQEYIDLIFNSMYKFCPTLIPTTYEAAAEYLREEKMKPKGKRDLRREFCYLSFTKIQESVGKPTLFLLETQTLIAVGPGHSLAVPTIDCPPWAFDRDRNTDPTIILFDPVTREPLDAVALMTYFTNTDPNQKHAFNEDETNIIQYKGKMYE